jgi:hypothetical protein
MKTNANSTASLEPSTHEADFEATDKDFERMMQMLTGFFVTQIASAVATYSIADHLAKGPATAEKIAAIEGIDSTATFRLLRACGNVRMGGLPEETGSLWMRDKTERRVNQSEKPGYTHHQGQPRVRKGEPFGDIFAAEFLAKIWRPILSQGEAKYIARLFGNIDSNPLIRALEPQATVRVLTLGT